MTQDKQSPKYLERFIVLVLLENQTGWICLNVTQPSHF